MKGVLLLLLMLPLLSNCIAQSTQSIELHFNSLSIKDGLPEGAITSMLQDKEGYIWIGTQAGLVRYDGYTTKVYQFGIEDPLHATITSIYEDRSGKLWIGTLYEGLYHYNRAADTFVSYKHNPKDANSLGAGFIGSMHDDRKGNLWMLLYDQGFKGRSISLFDIKTHLFKQFGISEKGNHHINASEYDYTSLFEDSKGIMWIATNNGFYEYAASADKFIPHFASTDAGQQKTFGWPIEDAGHPGVIWMNIRDTKSGKPEGLSRYNIADNTIKYYRHIPGDSTSLETDSVYTI